jgi:hypothetical protein
MADTSDRTLVVISGSEQETREFCRIMGVPRRRVIHAGSAASVDGISGFDVVRIGHWRDRPNLNRLEDVLARNYVKQQ